MAWCEDCKDYQDDAYRRPELGGRILCNQHYYERMRKNSPTGLVRRPTHFVMEDEADDARRFVQGGMA